MMAHNLLKKIEHALGADALLERMPQKKVKNALGLSSMVDLAAALCIPYETLRSRIQAGVIPKPEIHLGRRWFFTSDQVNEIKTKITDGSLFTSEEPKQ
jgi:hypothetical protein